MEKSLLKLGLSKGDLPISQEDLPQDFLNKFMFTQFFLKIYFLHWDKHYFLTLNY